MLSRVDVGIPESSTLNLSLNHDGTRRVCSAHGRLKTISIAPCAPGRLAALTSRRRPVALHSTMPRRPAEHEDDELDDLPPIDGALGDEPETSHDLDEIDDPEATDAGTLSNLGNVGVGGNLDDSTGEDEPPDLSELEGDETESGWVDESVDPPELDLGDPMLLDAGEESLSLEDEEEAPAVDEEFGIGEGGERSVLDAADEGPIGADEELREADLPALDADDERDQPTRDDDEALLDERVAGDEPHGAPWAAEPWPRVGPPLGRAWTGLTRGITALACVARGALVAGRTEAGAHQLVRLDLEGGRQILNAEGVDGGRGGRRRRGSRRSRWREGGSIDGRRRSFRAPRRPGGDHGGRCVAPRRRRMGADPHGKLARGPKRPRRQNCSRTVRDSGRGGRSLSRRGRRNRRPRRRRRGPAIDAR